jgi:hypothetical protein
MPTEMLNRESEISSHEISSDRAKTGDEAARDRGEPTVAVAGR